MSKQTVANEIFINGRLQSATRSRIINIIEIDCNVSAAYASTLYNNARKTADALNVTADVTGKTTTITKKSNGITPTFLSDVRVEIEAAMKTIFDKHGMAVDVGSMRYTANDFTMKIKVIAGTKADAAEKNFNSFAYLFGLEGLFGKKFTNAGKTYTIAGINHRAKRYPVIAECVSTGKSFKFPSTISNRIC